MKKMIKVRAEDKAEIKAELLKPGIVLSWPKGEALSGPALACIQAYAQACCNDITTAPEPDATQ